MTAFILIAVVLTAIAASVVAWPLLRSRQSRLAGGAAALLVAAAAAGLYPLWSNWDWHATPAGPATNPQVLAMVAQLEQKMRAAPNDVKGWLLLGRSYITLERVDDAVMAYEHAHRLDANDVEALLGLGEALSMRADGSITPEAAQLFEQAVALEPDNATALLYSGFGAAARGDRATARKRWLLVKSMHPPAELDELLDQRIAELGTADMPGGGASAPGMAAAAPAPDRGAGAGGAGAGGAGAGGGATQSSPAGEATVNLTIAPALKARLNGDAALFVFAREPGGQGPPLAAKRLTSAAIGSQIELSAADSMVPGRVLIAGQTVSITARVSFSGQPLPAAGDLYGELTYQVGRDGVRNLVIDRVAQ